MHPVSEMMEDFMNFDPRKNEIEASKAPSIAFQQMGQKQALETFHLAAKTVPAYKDFLKKNKINPDDIKTFEDFEKVPLTDKKNYLTKYPLKDLLVEGNFNGKSAITSSSGSAGAPLYWPRYAVQDFGAAKGFEAYLVNTFDIDKKSTLHVNCSGMGVWTAGDYIFLLNKFFSYKHSNNTSISPGIDLDNTTQLLEKNAPYFDQTIIYSYPPFAKDLVDNLPMKFFKKTKIKIVVYGEPYTEKWRDYILNKINGYSKTYDVSSVLGSSEGGLVGSESKSCTVIRKMSSKNQKLCKALFREPRVPSLVQYNPMSKFIEIIGSNVVLTHKGGLPLIRYDTHDYGNLLTKEEIINVINEHSKEDLIKETQRLDGLVTSMPFLYVFGRSDFTASIYGVLVYPETIKDILASRPFSKFFSGRFVMTTETDKDVNQFLNIILEVKKTYDTKDVAIPTIEKTLANHLRIYSSEYSKLLNSVGQKVYPRVDIRGYGDQEYFSSKNKQKYLI